MASSSGKRLRSNFDMDVVERLDGLLNLVHEQERFWGLVSETSNTHNSLTDVLGFVNRVVDTTSKDPEQIMTDLENKKSSAKELYYESVSIGAFEQITMDEAFNYHEENGSVPPGRSEYNSKEFFQRVARIFRQMDLVSRIVESGIQATHTLNGTLDMTFDPDDSGNMNPTDLLSFMKYCQSNMDGENGKKLKTNETLDLYMFLLDKLCLHGYRRYDADVYRQIFNADGHPTHAWERKMSISEFVECNIPKETQGYFFGIVYKSSGVKSHILERLSNTVDIHFPQLKKDRHILSFVNGIFVTNRRINGKLVPEFMSYENNDISGNVVAAAYHQKEFPENIVGNIETAGDITKEFIMSIETPALSTILTFQRLSEDVQLWMLVFIGRMLYEVGEGDNWQVMPFIKGVAGSGKSTIILDVLHRFFEKEDYFNVSNNCETKFGLQNCLKDNSEMKLAMLLPEVKSDFGMEQGDWQQAVSGERIPINRKNLGTITRKFTMPMFAAGNQMIGYDDNSNSVARRVPVFKFNFPVRDQDGGLKTKLDAEMAYIILKSCLAYCWASNLYGSANVWTVLPREVQEERKILVESQNSLVNFLSSGNVLVGEHLYCPQKVFINNFKSFVQENNLKKSRWCTDFYETAFAEYNIKVVKNTQKPYNGQPLQGTFFSGVDIIDGDSTPSGGAIFLIN